MQEARFKKFFSMKPEDLKTLREDIWDKWTWDKNDPELKKEIDEIDTFLKARQMVGLDKAT